MTAHCFCCDPANPDRVATHDAFGSAIRVPARFQGPPSAVNGGFAVGVLACQALAASQRDGNAHPAVERINARLHRAVPHSSDLRAEATALKGGYDSSIRDRDDVLAGGRVEIAALQREPRPGDAVAGLPEALAGLVAELRDVAEPETPPFFEETGDHPIPGCFSCGPANAGGLQVFPRFAGHGVTWASWSPEPSFTDGQGSLAPTIVASALDCSSGICLPREEQEALLRDDHFYLLGSLDVRYFRIASPDRAYHVVAKARRRDGRKFYGASVLFDEDGTAYAAAEAIWIIVAMTRTQAFGAS